MILLSIDHRIPDYCHLSAYIVVENQPQVVLDDTRKRETPKQKRKVSSTNKKETA